MSEQPPHIPYFKSMLERNWADGKVKEMSYYKDITQFAFRRAAGYVTNHDFENMCKYCKIELDMIAEWQIAPVSNKAVNILIFLKHHKEAKLN